MKEKGVAYLVCIWTLKVGSQKTGFFKRLDFRVCICVRQGMEMWMGTTQNSLVPHEPFDDPLIWDFCFYHMFYLFDG